jgi:Ca-activated chloride channel family protein
MVFDNPGALWLLPFLPFLHLGLWLVESTTKREVAATLKLDQRRLERGLAAKYVLAGAITALLVAALALPKLPFPTVETPQKTGEVLLLVDVSASMAAQKDLDTPNRMQRVKTMLYELVNRMEEFKEVKISLHGFTSIARSLVPPVGREDYPYLRKSIKELLGINSVPGEGSSLGRPLLNIVGKFSPTELAKLVILFSDGEPFLGLTQGITQVERDWTEQAIKKANEAGIHIITVGVGEREGAKVPLYDRSGFTGEYGKLETGDYVSKLEEDGLKDIAARTGGRYFGETDREALIEYIRDTLRPATTTGASQEVKTYRSIAPWFLLATSPLWVIFARRYLLH